MMFETSKNVPKTEKCCCVYKDNGRQVVTNSKREVYDRILLACPLYPLIIINIYLALNSNRS